MRDRTLFAALVLLFATSLVHFVHNAEFLTDYPGLPTTWTRSGVYAAWLAMTAIGLVGWSLVRRGYRVLGLAALAAYAMAGLDSLGHYVVAPASAHTLAMNSTILLEVTSAGLVLLEVTRVLVISSSSSRGSPRSRP